MDIHALYRVFQDWFRPQRMRKIVARSGMTTATTVLDVGGDALNWGYSSVRPKLTLLNIELIPNADIGLQVVGDGCHLPFMDDAFDFVFSNSVIEHVSDHDAFAQEIIRVGKKFYVQTPNKWFPIEPHLITPLIHWLPLAWRQRLVRRFTVWAWIAKPSKESIDYFLATTKLLGVHDLRRLFPDSALEKERFIGLTKSIAVWGD